VSRIDALFAELRSGGRKAFMPFITAGDPDIEFTAEVLRELVRSGATMCELGIPYSDPIADGPVIQASYTRALEKKISLGEIFEMAKGVLPELSAPVVTMVSYAIVYRRGLERYVETAKQAGFAGAIIPDLPYDEAVRLAEVCRKADFSLIQLVTPTTPRDRALAIAETSTGFLYYVAVTGITGERNELPESLLREVGWLREQTDLPICIGFGISRPEQVKQLAPVCDGLIVGSAIVRRMAEAASRDRKAVISDVGAYVASLVAALES